MDPVTLDTSQNLISGFRANIPSTVYQHQKEVRAAILNIKRIKIKAKLTLPEL